MIRVLILSMFVIHAAEPRPERPVASIQQPTEIKGAAILTHAIGVLALKSVELMSAGKLDELMALRTKSDQADWKTASAADKKDMAARYKERTPSQAVLTDAIRKNGVLRFEGNAAQLSATAPTGDIIAIYEQEGGQWRASVGPMLLAGGPRDPANETRVEGAAILKHPIGDLALRYTDAVQKGSTAEMLLLMSRDGQTKWRALPASERTESLAYLKKTIPARAQLSAAIGSGGVLIIEGDSRATLNVIQTESRQTSPGVFNSTSTTTFIPFVMDAGQWKVAK